MLAYFDWQNLQTSLQRLGNHWSINILILIDNFGRYLDYEALHFMDTS